VIGFNRTLIRRAFWQNPARLASPRDIAREQFDPERFLNVRYSGHLSPYGNRVIAEAVARAIRPVLRGLPTD
jgi:hypothetical protein